MKKFIILLFITFMISSCSLTKPFIDTGKSTIKVEWYLYYNEIPYGEIDHINRIRSDNRICNLRLVNHQQNNFNRNSNGYCYHKKYNVYQAQIGINNKSIFLGNYNNSEDAHNAYLEAKKKYHII